jgi:4-hydroxythreonine-4-phosphate dehydrogenase
MMLPKIAVTIGDPAGIGAEIALKALADPEICGAADWHLIGDGIALKAAAAASTIDLSSLVFTHVDPSALDNRWPFQMGQLQAAYGRAAIEYVRIAVEMCLRQDAEALVTAPLNKEAVSLSGEHFSGHTEYIAQLCGATESRMLLVSDKLATVHVSTHIPLEQACKLEQGRIVRTIELGDQAMRLMLQRSPRIAVCGLNPHAGENNLFGAQDSEVIAPAIAEARQRGIDCTGPHSPDAVFIWGLRGDFDLIVAMYHDQGHIPMKLIDFEQTVNVSLGIPIIRTSVDHGTAFDIAGQDKADPRNMKAAMRLALRMALGQRQRTACGVR